MKEKATWKRASHKNLTPATKTLFVGFNNYIAVAAAKPGAATTTTTTLRSLICQATLQLHTYIMYGWVRAIGTGKLTLAAMASVTGYSRSSGLH